MLLFMFTPPACLLIVVGVSCVQFDDNRIVSGSSDKTIKVWNIRTNTTWAALTLEGHSGDVRCLHLHGNRLVSGSSDRTIKVSISCHDRYISRDNLFVIFHVLTFLEYNICINVVALVGLQCTIIPLQCFYFHFNFLIRNRFGNCLQRTGSGWVQPVV